MTPSHGTRKTEDNLRVTMAHGAQPEDQLEDWKDGMAKENPRLGQDSPEVQREPNETNSNDFDSRNHEAIHPKLDDYSTKDIGEHRKVEEETIHPELDKIGRAHV